MPMKTIPVALATALLLAPAAHAQPVNIDTDSGGVDALIAAMTADGVDYTNRADVARQAFAVCASLSRGGSYAVAIEQAAENNPWSITEAALFVRAAHQTFCPGFEVTR